MELIINKLSKTYYENGIRLGTLNDISLEIESGNFVSVIGPSGCGKSTLCNLISGIEKPDTGEILLNGKSILGLTNNVGYMPQKDLLLPWRTILDNIILGCDIQQVKRSESRNRAMQLLEEFELADFAGYYPHQISGGMKQRVALLRTVMCRKTTLLLDEPFGALDALTRKEMQKWLLNLWSKYKHTILFITHDIEEAILLSNKIVVLSQRPARVIEEIKVDFSYPRSTELLLDREAASLKKELVDLLNCDAK